jgi:aminoglycoside phosphotransferase (APT) family kinase protein
VILVPGGLRDRIQALLGTSPRSLEAVGPGHSNLVGATPFEDRSVVVKAAQRAIKRADIVRESVVLRLMEDTGVAPVHLASSVDDEWAVLVMERIDGTVALHRLQPSTKAKTAATTSRLASMLGSALCAVHATAPGPVSSADMTRLGLSIERRMADAADMLRQDRCGLPAELLAPVFASLEDPAHARGVAFLHGDPGVHNAVIVAPRPNGPEPPDAPTRIKGLAGTMRLVDWEHAGYGNPLHDISWAVWTMRRRGFDDAAIDAFTSAYGEPVLRGIGWDAPTAKTLVCAQMACLLVRTLEGAPERGIWLERINTLLRG